MNQENKNSREIYPALYRLRYGNDAGGREQSLTETHQEENYDA
jgi:hypothetical protein